MADSYTLRAGNYTSDVTGFVESTANDLDQLAVDLMCMGETFGGAQVTVLAETMQAVADTLATSDGTVHIRCYYRTQGDGSA